LSAITPDCACLVRHAGSAITVRSSYLRANQVGLASAWIHRRAGKKGTGATHPPEHMPDYGFRFVSMAQMAKAHQDSLRTS